MSNRRKIRKRVGKSLAKTNQTAPRSKRTFIAKLFGYNYSNPFPLLVAVFVLVTYSYKKVEVDPAVQQTEQIETILKDYIAENNVAGEQMNSRLIAARQEANKTTSKNVDLDYLEFVAWQNHDYRGIWTDNVLLQIQLLMIKHGHLAALLYNNVELNIKAREIFPKLKIIFDEVTAARLRNTKIPVVGFQLHGGITEFSFHGFGMIVDSEKMSLGRANLVTMKLNAIQERSAETFTSVSEILSANAEKVKSRMGYGEFGGVILGVAGAYVQLAKKKVPTLTL